MASSSASRTPVTTVRTLLASNTHFRQHKRVQMAVINAETMSGSTWLCGGHLLLYWSLPSMKNSAGCPVVLWLRPAPVTVHLRGTGSTGRTLTLYGESATRSQQYYDGSRYYFWIQATILQAQLARPDCLQSCNTMLSLTQSRYSGIYMHTMPSLYSVCQHAA